MQKRMENLIKILLNKECSIAERDDAAMDLSEYDDDAALNALVKIGRDKDDDPTVLDSCGESMAIIWIKRNIFNKDVYISLSQNTQRAINYVFEYEKPEWLCQIEMMR